LDSGQQRGSGSRWDGSWKVNDWVKKASDSYFPSKDGKTIELDLFEFHDKMALNPTMQAGCSSSSFNAVAKIGAFLASALMSKFMLISGLCGQWQHVFDTWNCRIIAQDRKNVSLELVE